MANDVELYLASLPEPQRSRIAAIYDRARVVVPDAVEGVSYAMPALLYKGKGILAVMNTRHHIGVYPFANLGEFEGLATDAGLATTKGSIHLGVGQELPDELLTRLLRRRVDRIDGR